MNFNNFATVNYNIKLP